MSKPIRFTKAARKHKIGEAKVLDVIANGTVEPTVVKTTGQPWPGVHWDGSGAQRTL